MRFSYLLTVIFALLLAGCQSFGPKPLAPQRIVWEHLKPGCAGEHCPLVNVDTLRFDTEPELNKLIEDRLLRLVVDNPDEPLPSSIYDYERTFLATADDNWMSYMQAEVIDQHDQLVVIEFSSYVFTGGAHGMPGRAFFNYDRDLKRPLSLDEMLLPGQLDNFWQKAAEAHQRWLTKEEADAEFIRNWPFERTENVAFLKDNVMLKYDVYAIAPYSSGHPVLTIDYKELKGILKPEYIP